MVLPVEGLEGVLGQIFASAEGVGGGQHRGDAGGAQPEHALGHLDQAVAVHVVGHVHALTEAPVAVVEAVLRAVVAESVTVVVGPQPIARGVEAVSEALVHPDAGGRVRPEASVLGRVQDLVGGKRAVVVPVDPVHAGGQHPVPVRVPPEGQPAVGGEEVGVEGVDRAVHVHHGQPQPRGSVHRRWTRGHQRVELGGGAGDHGGGQRRVQRASEAQVPAVQGQLQQQLGLPVHRVDVTHAHGRAQPVGAEAQAAGLQADQRLLGQVRGDQQRRQQPLVVGAGQAGGVARGVGEPEQRVDRGRAERLLGQVDGLPRLRQRGAGAQQRQGQAGARGGDEGAAPHGGEPSTRGHHPLNDPAPWVRPR